MMQRLFSTLLLGASLSLLACGGGGSTTELPPAETTQPGEVNPQRPAGDSQQPTTDEQRPTNDEQRPVSSTTPGSNVDPGEGAGGRGNQEPGGNAGNGNAGGPSGPGPGCADVDPNNCRQACRCAGLENDFCDQICEM